MKRFKIISFIISVILGISTMFLTNHFFSINFISERILLVLIYSTIFSIISLSLYSIIKKVDVRNSIAMLGIASCGIIGIACFFISQITQKKYIAYVVILCYISSFFFFSLGTEAKK